MRKRLMITAALVALCAAAAGAQDKPGTPPAAPSPAPGTFPSGAVGAVPLKVTVMLSRYQGDKRLSSLPYVLGVTTGPKATSLRMGIEVPVRLGGAIGNVSYRTVGTNIDCRADTMTGSLFQLTLTVEDLSLNLGSQQKSADSTNANDLPRFRTFNTSFTMLLRDGQTMQYQSATDPVTGEVMKIDITLNVMK